MFWMRKILARAVFPVPVVLELVLLGAVLTRFRRTRRWGVGLVVAGICVLGICSQPSVGNALLNSLESQYPTLNVSTLVGGTNYVVGVAGNGFRLAGARCNGGFNDPFLIRLQEAGRIARALEQRGLDYHVLVSAHDGGTAGERHAALREYLAAFGVPARKVRLVEGAGNSRLEVEAFVRQPGRLVLVSSACHLPRLMKLAARNGVEALAAPAGWRASPARFGIGIPAADALAHTRTYVYERLGALFP